jgi:hypothetical protein
VEQDQTVSEMVEEVLDRQAKSLEDARRAVAATQAGQQLRDLATGEHRHEPARRWQASVFWERAEERFMYQVGSEVLSRFVAERSYSWQESDMERLEGEEERSR